MHCAKCDFQNANEARFCRQCGTSLATPANTAAPVELPSSQSPVDAASAEIASDSPSLLATCLNCQTSNLHGKRFCRTCGSDLRIANVDADKPAPAEAACAKCGTPKLSDKRFCRACGFDSQPLTSQSSASSTPHPAAVTEPTIVATNGTKRGNAKVIATIGAVLTVLVAGAGTALTLHFKHAQRATAVEANATAVSAPPTQAVSATPVVASSVAALAPPTPVAPATPVVTSQQAAQTSNDAAASAAAPTATQQEPASQTAVVTDAITQPAVKPPVNRVSVHRQPSNGNNDGSNATIRAAIAGSLADGAGCYESKKFDCAISDAEAALRLDPHDSRALSLRARAKAAQQAALNNLSIE
jgi:hypothetical protein